jgi:hypothetical protein
MRGHWDPARLPWTGAESADRRGRQGCVMPDRGWPAVTTEGLRPGPGNVVASTDDHLHLARSEELAGICQPLWELRAGHRHTPPIWLSNVMPGTLDSPLTERILDRLEEFAARWQALQIDRSITLPWPLDGRPAGRAGTPATAITAVTGAARPRERCTHGDRANVA